MCWNRKSIKEQGSVSMENNNGKKLNINYKLSDYERPSVTADILIFSQKGSDGDRLRLLLIKRKHDPYEGCFALPGGFVNPDETVDQAAKRELEEETGLGDIEPAQLRLFSTPGRDPRGWVITQAFIAVIDEDQHTVTAGDDAAMAAWFDVGFSVAEESEDKCVFDLTLKGCGQTLSARAEVKRDTGAPGNPDRVAVLESKGLAFDHAWMICCGIVELKHL